MKLRSLSKCKSHILNTALMLHLTRRSPPRCASSHNCDAAPFPSRAHQTRLLRTSAAFTLSPRDLHAQPLLPRFFLSSPVGEPAKLNPSHASAERNNLRSTADTLPKSKKWGYTEIASLLLRATDVPALKQRFLDYDLTRAAVSPERRGRQGIRLTTGSETCSVTFQHYGLMLRVSPRPVISRPLVTIRWHTPTP